MASPQTLHRWVANTPASRDRYVDLLRAVSIGVVVLGHWLMAVVYERDGQLLGVNALDVVPGLWLATWILQVMPLFFFVGGFSNFLSWRAASSRGETYGRFLASRTQRLMKPTLVFIGAWSGASVALSVAGPEIVGPLGVALELVAKPLWFLAVYVLVTALAPFMIAIHERHRGKALAFLAASAAACDIARVGFDINLLGYLNFASVWLFAHQLGFFYADGTFGARSRAFFRRMAAGGLVLLVALTSSGIYALSMVGSASEKASNTYPPSICVIALTLWLVGLAMMLRDPATRWLSRPRVWTGVVAANSVIMTVFLWHLTALLLAVVALYPLGFPQPDGGTALWWAWRPLWMGSLGLILIPFVAFFGRFEAAGLLRRKAPATAGSNLVLGVALLVAGLACLAQFGFSPVGGVGFAIPLGSAALTMIGTRLISPRSATSGELR
jgi:fucose 4-O-acetylase-like acetyltransferase